MMTRFSLGPPRPCHRLFWGLCHKEPRSVTLKATPAASELPRSQGKSLYSCCQLRREAECKQQVGELDLILQELVEQKGAAGQSSTTASMGVGESSRLGLRFQPWLGGGGYSWMTDFLDFPLFSFPGCLR